MIDSYNRIGFFSGSTLKIIACVLMTIDHIGLVIFPEIQLFRVIGRLAFPLFAFFIAEGCKYSKNKTRRLGLMLSIGVLFLAFYYLYEKKIYANIFLTFSMSIIVIYVLQFCKKWFFSRPGVLRCVLAMTIFSSFVLLTFILFENVHFEYGFKGMLVPVFVSLFDFTDITVPKWLRMFDNHCIKLLCMTVSLVLLSVNANLGNIQYFSILSILILAFYNGEAGNRNMKYLFYIFYPAHLVIIEGISLICSNL